MSKIAGIIAVIIIIVILAVVFLRYAPSSWPGVTPQSPPIQIDIGGNRLADSTLFIQQALATAQEPSEPEAENFRNELLGGT